MPMPFSTPGGLAKSQIVLVSSADILALVGTPVQLLAAPGAGQAVLVTSCAFERINSTIPYVVASGDEAQCSYASDAANAVTFPEAVLSLASDSFQHGTPFTGTAFVTPDVSNNAVMLVVPVGSAGYSLGDGDLVVTLIYYLVATA